MLQTVKAERSNLTTAPICSKGDNSQCFMSVKRVKAVITKDYLLEKARVNLGSADTRVVSSMQSEDLQADGVYEDELISAGTSAGGASSKKKGSSSQGA